MANYSTLKAAVADVVKTNGTQAITGANLQAVLLSIINSVGGGGYIFKGVATPSTDAGTPDENVFYIGGAGTYANFGASVTVPVGSIGVFKYNGSWTKTTISDGLLDEVKNIGRKVDFIGPNISWTYGYMITTGLSKSANSSYCYSAPIYCEAGTPIRIATGGSYIGIICASDENGNLTSLLKSTETAPSDEVTIYDYNTATAGYVVLCYKYMLDGAYYMIGDTIQSSGSIKTIQEKTGIEGGISWTTGKRIVASDLSIANSTTAMYSSPVFVKKGTRVIVKNTGTGTSLVTKCQSDGTLISALVVSNNASNNVWQYEYVMTEDTYIVICYNYTVDGTAYYIEVDYATTPSIDNIKNNINDITGEGGAIWNYGVLINATNLTQNANANYKMSNPIFVKSGTKIYISTSGLGTSLVTKCQSDGTLVSSLLRSNGTNGVLSDYEYTMTEDTYIVICYNYSLVGSYHSIGGVISNIIGMFDTFKKHYKILVLGNSYSADSWAYVPFILKNYGITCEITVCYRGGISLQQLYHRWEDADAQDVETEYEPLGTYSRHLYEIDTRTMNQWTSITQLKSAKECVEMGGWDIISMQQWSGLSIDQNSYEPYANDIINLIRQSLSTPYILAWNGVCTRPTYDNIPSSLSAHQYIYGREPISLYLPFGTAVFNARTNPTLAAIGDYAGDEQAGYPAHNLWCADGVHLQEGIPKYVEALALVQAMFVKFGIKASVIGDSFRPTEANIVGKTMEKRGTSVGVTDANCYLAQKCAVQAVKFPFVVTTIY